jgi:formylglycine-generating enzyme required for sulfatase activity
MKATTAAVLLVAVSLLTPSPHAAAAAKCPQDAVKVGPACVDTYEASVWQVPAGNTALVRRIQRGIARLADLTAAGAVPLGCLSGQTAYPVGFPPNGNWTVPVYAVSVPGVLPSTCLTWFQAEQACALSGKHLVMNDEWQTAAAGTPDGSPCVVGGGGVGVSGTAGCKSSWGAFDLVGNAAEWVGAWGDQATACTQWSAALGNDTTCVGGDGTLNLPGALVRGGSQADGTGAGVFSVTGTHDPTYQDANVGFRCAR